MSDNSYIASLYLDYSCLITLRLHPHRHHHCSCVYIDIHSCMSPRSAAGILSLCRRFAPCRGGGRPLKPPHPTDKLLLCQIWQLYHAKCGFSVYSEHRIFAPHARPYVGLSTAANINIPFQWAIVLNFSGLCQTVWAARKISYVEMRTDIWRDKTDR